MSSIDSLHQNLIMGLGIDRMGVRDLETLRENLLEIERIKTDIDEQIFNVRQDVSILIEARDSTLPRLRNEKKEMQSELLRIDEEIVNDAELNNLKVEKENTKKEKSEICKVRNYSA